MQIHPIRTPGLGDTTYVLIEDRQAIVVNPQRDIDRFETVLNSTGAELRYVLETHLHNDYISGGRDLANKAGGELVLPSGAAPLFRHRPAFHNENLSGGRAHGETDPYPRTHAGAHVLSDPHRGRAGSRVLQRQFASGLGRAQRPNGNRTRRHLVPSSTRLGQPPCRSARRSRLYPTHGAGSFCTASGAGNTASTIDEEKATNPVLKYASEDALVAGELSGLVPHPSYYRFMGPMNIASTNALQGLTSRLLMSWSLKERTQK